MDSDKILENWKKLLSYVDEYFEDNEKQNTLKLFKHFEDRFIDAPASSRPNHHNCFAGGLVDHMLRVIDTSLKQKQLFSLMGVQVKASDADIVMAAMFHDLGKIGDLDNAYYIRQTDEWRRNKLNEWYTFNPKLEPLSVTDRALWLLQWFDVKISQEVWKAIKLADGMFDDGNTALYRKHDTDNVLHYIVHFADWTSTVVEKQLYKQSLENVDVGYQEGTPKDRNVTDKKIQNMKDKFSELFPNG